MSRECPRLPVLAGDFWHGCGTPHDPVPAGALEGTGRYPVMVVPWPGADRTWSRPPRAASRSAMFRRPDPIGVWRASCEPLSVVVMMRRVGRRWRRCCCSCCH